MKMTGQRFWPPELMKVLDIFPSSYSARSISAGHLSGPEPLLELAVSSGHLV